MLRDLSYTSHSMQLHSHKQKSWLLVVKARGRENVVMLPKGYEDLIMQDGQILKIQCMAC
jgi:hypothetical protein